MTFVCILLWKARAQPNSAWVGMDELRGMLPVIHGRQMLRFIDTLASIDFPIKYESKTCGRYRLALSPDEVRVDVDEGGLEEFIGAKPSQAGSDQAESWSLPECHRMQESFAKLTLADSQYYDGNLGTSANHAYHLFLCESETAPPELRGIALLRLAKTCRRLNRHDEALAALRRLGKLLHGGGAPNLEVKAHLCKMMVYFDQGHIARATAMMESLDIRGCNDASALGEYYNLMGLLAFRKIQQLQKDTAKSTAPNDPDVYSALLRIATHYYQQSLAQHAAVSDYHAMQCTCFNLGNLFLYLCNERLVPLENENFLELGMRWMAHCELICHKFGVGMDSVYSRIALIKAAMNAGFEMEKLNALTGDLFRYHASLEEMARATLAEAKIIGNPLEQAALHALLMRFAHERADHHFAETCRKNALVIYLELKRADLARPLKVAMV